MSPSKEVVLGLIQMSCDEDPKKNLDKAITRIKEAAKAGAQIISLQELFISRYFCQTNDPKFFALAEPVPGPSSEVLSKIAKEEKIVLVASLFEKDHKNYYNTACVINADGSFLGKYRKVHVPDDLQNYYSEMYYFKPGDLGFPVFETRYGKIGTLVCWDQWYPEGARALALKGAEFIFYPTAIGWPVPPLSDAPLPSREREVKVPETLGVRAELGEAEFNAWVTIQRSHAIANGVFVAAVNRTGSEDHLNFWGGSFVADPLGRILKQASHDKEETLIVSCERNRIEETRKDWPFLTCRRASEYSR